MKPESNEPDIENYDFHMLKTTERKTSGQAPMRRRDSDNPSTASTTNLRPVRPPNVIIDGNASGGRCSVCRRMCASVFFSTLGIGTVLVLYIFCGALVFNCIEGVTNEVASSSSSLSSPGSRSSGLDGIRGDSVVLTLGVHEQHQLRAAKELRARTVESLWRITEELNILYKDNWTALADREIANFQTELLAVGASNNDEQNVRGGTSPNPPSPTKEAGSKYSTDGPKGDPSSFYRFEGQEEEPSTFFQSFLYSLSLITTVGYNGRIPQSSVGKIAAMFLALLGLPILFIYLTIVGSSLACAFRKLYSIVCCCCVQRRRGNTRQTGGSNNSTLEKSTASSEQPFARHNNWPPTPSLSLCQDCSMARRRRERMMIDPSIQGENRSIPVWVCFLLVICYVSAGASLFCVCNGWTYIDSFFFCFAALGTIGIVESHPTEDNAETGGTLFVLMCTCYLLVGLSVLAMCVDLMQDKWRLAILKLTQRFSFDNSEKVRRTSWLYDTS